MGFFQKNLLAHAAIVAALFAFSLFLRVDHLNGVFDTEMAVTDYSPSENAAETETVPYWLSSAIDSPTYVVPAFYMYERGEFKYGLEMERRIGIHPGRSHNIFFWSKDSGPRFSFDYGAEQSYTRRLPLYSAFLQVIPAADSLKSGFYRAFFWQCVMGSLTVVAVYFTAFAMLQRKWAAALCALAFAINMESITLSSKILSDTMYMFLFSLASLFAVLWFRRPDRFSRGALAWLALAVLSSIAASYTRPVGLVLIGALGLVTGLVGIYDSLKARSLKPCLRYFSAGLAIAAVSAAAIAPWIYRNYKVSGFASYETTPYVNSLFYIAVPIVAKEQGTPLIDAMTRAYAVAEEVAKEKGVDLSKNALDQQPGILSEASHRFFGNRSTLKAKIAGAAYMFYPPLSSMEELNIVTLGDRAQIDKGSAYAAPKPKTLAEKALALLDWINWRSPAHLLAFCVELLVMAFYLSGFALFLLLALGVPKLRTPENLFLLVMVLVQTYAAAEVGSPRYGLVFVPTMLIFAAMAYAFLFGFFKRRVLKRA